MKKLVQYSLFVIVIITLFLFSSAEQSANTARNEQWRTEIRQLLHIPAQLPPLDLHEWSSFSPASGVKAERVTYNTLDGMLVPAIVYKPDPMPKKKLPGIVIVNGHGGDKFAWYSFWSGIVFARAGAVVVTYDLIGEGERNSDKKSITGAHDKLPKEYGTYLAGLMQVDLMQAVTLLTNRKEVDSKRIAVLGYSLGAFVVGIAGALDTRIHATILAAGGVFDSEGGYYDSNRLPCQMPPYRALANIEGPELRGPILFALNADRGPTLVINGLGDTVMDIAHHDQKWFAALQKQTIALHGSKENVFTTIFYPKIGHRPFWLEREGFLWLNDQIHFVNWDRKQIEQAPLVHIGEWANKNNVVIAKNFATENREAGVMAVGSDVPGVEREKLMALPPEIWNKLQDQLTYDAWAQRLMDQEPAEPVE